MDKKNEIEDDFVHLARIALSGRPQDIQLLLQRTARRHRSTSPEFAEAVANLLRESPTRASPLRRQAETPMPVDMDSRFHLLRVESTPFLDHEPIMTSTVENALRLLLQERKKPESLLSAGLEPTKTALFVGPPGVGKTMAARWIARELGRPLVILDLASVMSSYLGRTGTNLRYVLDYAKSIDCVLLLDELDAIAKRRDDRGEVGELKRLVTVLIQQIDDWPSTGLLIAATNHPDLLDPAIWRRFEARLDFTLPDRETIAKFAESLLAPHLTTAPVWSRILSVVMAGRSFSDVEREIAMQRRAAAVSDVKLDDRLTALIRPDTLSKSDRIVLATTLVNSGVMSQRNAQHLTGVARDTIRGHARKTKADKFSGKIDP